MIPVFTNERRRNINLGGATSVSTQFDILDEAKARRNQRTEQKRRTDSAIQLQAWWRGILVRRKIRLELNNLFQRDPIGLTGMRCLALLGQDEDALTLWSQSALDREEDALFLCSVGPEKDSWLVLLRQISARLLKSIATTPVLRDTNYRPIILLNLLKSPFGQELLQVLLYRGYYQYVSQAIRSIAVENKSQPVLPFLVNLVTIPVTILPTESPLYITAVQELVANVLIIPLLPNRIPLESLTHLSSHLPLSSLHNLDITAMSFSSISVESRVHLVANLLAFTPPRYSQMPPPALSAYIDLLTLVLNAIPIHGLEPAASHISPAWDGTDDSDDDDDAKITVTVVPTFRPSEPLPDLDARTSKRLQILPSTAHLTSLLKASQSRISSRVPLTSLIIALAIIWPTKKESVFTTVLLNSPGFIRELYKGFVRSSPLGKDESSVAVMDPHNAAAWSPLLCLSDLYTQSLITMGDDEFFGTGSGARNPLSLDELKSFSRQLLNIAFVLYWRDDQTNLQDSWVCPNLRITWQNAREIVTKCLVGIHSRDSRQPFVSSDHWHVISQIDMQSFVEAAITEEEQLSSNSGTPIRSLSKRQVTFMSPRLGVLNNIPFAIPFETRISIFRHFVYNDRQNLGIDFYSRTNRNRVTIRRGHVAQDGFDHLGDANLKSPIEITFIDQFGEPEAGIDGGGVFKEFFTSLCKEVFDTNRGLWLTTKQNELYPNPHSYAIEPHSLNWYRFIGRILGKAMYEGILVDVAFAGFFLAKWLGKQSLLDDLASLDPDLYNGLIFLKHYQGNPEDLSLNFTAAVEEFGITKSIDLILNGSNIAVTKDNRLKYIYLVSHFRLSKQIKLQSEAFFEGLSEMIDPKWLRMFNQQEVQILIGGVNSPVDIEDLRKNTNYGGLYDDDQPTIVAFWNVVHGFDHEQRRALLRFATSCSRPPLLGFKELTPNFSIRDAGTDQHRLPTASTCVNLLKLPRYKDERVLREKLIQAIFSGAGFDLS